MAWVRTCRLVVKTPRSRVGDKWQWTETEIKDVHFDATITRSRVWNDNEANITVYNLSRDTANALFRRGASIQVYAGYDNAGEGLMFQGSIISHSRTSNGVDSMDTLFAMCLRGTSTKTFAPTPVSMAYPGLHSLAKVYDAIAQHLGLVLYGAENVEGVDVNDFYYAGMIGGAIDYLDRIITANGCGVLRDDASLVIYKLDSGDSKYVVTYLDFTCGLLEIRDATDYAGDAKEKVAEIEESRKFVIKEDGSEDVLAELEEIYTKARKEYRAQTLLLPKLRPNALVDVQTDEIKGQFVVDSMHIAVGNLPDSSFGMELYLLEVAEPSEGRGIVTYTYDEEKKK